MEPMLRWLGDYKSVVIRHNPSEVNVAFLYVMYMRRSGSYTG